MGLKALYPVIWTCLIIGGIISSIRKNKKTGSKISGKKTSQPAKPQSSKLNEVIQQNVIPKYSKLAELKESGNAVKGLNNSLRSTSSGNLIQDDRENDWLAKEIQYERRVLFSEASILRQEHFINCDADKLKAEHEENCEVKPY